MDTKLRNFFGAWCIVAALAVMAQPYLQRLSSKDINSGENPFTSSQVVATQPDVALISGMPKNISIPSLGVNLPVIDGFYNQNNKTWTLTEDKAQFATMTRPNNNISGNTFIYGHNNPQVFSRLFELSPNDEVIIQTSNGHKFKYSFTSSFETSPYDNSPFEYSGPAILTIQTCSGIWFENRQLFTFKLVEVA